MARFTRIQVTLGMEKTGMVPVFYHPNIAISKKVLKSCYDGGVRVIEFTNRGDFAHRIFEELIHYCNYELPDMMLGAGSILDANTANLYLLIGANFIGSPIFSTEIGRTCNRRKVLWIPGCDSPSCIHRAHQLGAEVIKVFPASQAGGPDFVKAIREPFPWASLMPSGVTTAKENLKAWFDAGVICVGMGSDLITQELAENRDPNILTERISQTLKTIEQVRPG